MNEFMQRPSRPTAPSPANGPMGPAEKSMPQKNSGGKFNLGKGMHLGLGVLVFSVVVIAFGLLALMLFNTETAVQKENERVAEDTYQAVFLNDPNGQVYFGNLEALSDDTYRLTDIYYVQVQTAIQPETGEQTAAGVSLAKLGNELHGPQDVMYINRDHVLFWENLKTSGQVVCAIADYQINELGLDVTKDEGCDERAAENNSTSQQQSTGGTGTQATQPAGTPQQNDTPATDTNDTPATDTTN